MKKLSQGRKTQEVPKEINKGEKREFPKQEQKSKAKHKFNQ